MTETPVVFADYLRARLPRIEACMREVIDAAGDPELCAMLRYHLGFSDAQGNPTRAPAGKRIRPALVMLCAAAGGHSRSDEIATPAAAAVELLHNFSLIHDDIEDRDELRRGRDTLWKVWGIAKAINAGDTLFAMAHQALLRCRAAGAEADRTLRAMEVFDAMCVELTRGQHLDISFEQRANVSSAEYLDMISGKTAALTQACCEIGALLGGSGDAQVASLARFGRDLGLAFQIQDDALGIWGDPALTGKADSDLAHGKKTYPVLIAAERDLEFRRRFFAGTPSPEEQTALRERMERCGAREATEAAAEKIYAGAVAALASSGADADAAGLLAALARALFARDA